MQGRTRVALGLLLVASLAVFGGTLVRATLLSPSANAGASVSEQSGTPDVRTGTSSAPVRLHISAINIDAKVQQVGVTRSGAIAAPSNFTDVGWYRFGAHPGERGSAIIDGHVDNGLGLAGVFKNLLHLRTGDTVEVERADGALRRFRVSAVRLYHYQEVPMEEIVNQKERAELVLITCDGSWLKDERTYDERLVVFAQLY